MELSERRKLEFIDRPGMSVSEGARERKPSWQDQLASDSQEFESRQKNGVARSIIDCLARFRFL